jgi:hypothetical protein
VNFFERMFLRDYAFIETMHQDRSHHKNCEFAIISMGAWVVLVEFTLVAAACLLLREVIPPQLNIATAPKPILLAECIAIVLSGAWFVETVARPFKSARPANVDDFKVPQEQLKWWLTLLSIIPIVAAMAGVFMIFHGYI